MSTTLKDKVTVVELTKYGFKRETGAYVNWSSKLPDSVKGEIVPGFQYEMDLFISGGGKEYVNGAVVPGTKVDVNMESKVSKQSIANVGFASTKGRDFDKEARGKTRCALLEALLSNASVDTANMDKLFVVVDQGVSYVFGDDK